MCVTYMVHYACRYRVGTTLVTPSYGGQCPPNTIKYDESRDEKSENNCVDHELGKADSGIDSLVSDHTIEDPQPKPEWPKEPKHILLKGK
jgi:hypothetical protein